MAQTNPQDINRVLVLTADFQEYVDELRRHDPAHLQVVACDTAAAGREQVAECNIILGDPNLVAAVLDRAGRLLWVQSSFAGVDALCRPGMRRDYLLSGVKRVFGPLISEYVFAYILALERHLFEARQRQSESDWRQIPYRSLRGLTLGICGFGSIGRQVAVSGAHFGMRVLAYKRSPGASPLVERIYSGSEFGDFLAALDYLVLALPKTAQTDHLLDAAALRRMKSDAVLINVGRGSTLVQADLQQALEERRLRAAVLDVFEREPLPSDSPLWHLPNTFITPHVAAVSRAADIVGIFVENYRRFKRGQPLHDKIDFARGY